jgi:hypothetical protein
MSEEETTDDEEVKDSPKDVSSFWTKLKVMALQQHEKLFERTMLQYMEEGYNESTATRKAFNDILPTVRGTMNRLLRRVVKECDQVCEDRLMQKIRKRKKELQLDANFTNDEAWKLAIGENGHIDLYVLCDYEEEGENVLIFGNLT